MHLQLVTIHAFRSPQAVPLAAACLKASLEVRRAAVRAVTVSCSDFYCGDSLDEITRALRATGPDLIGFSLYAWNRDECLALAEKLRREEPALTIFGGGPEATADPNGLFDGNAFDFLVVGEGEITLREVVDRLETGVSLAGLPGIARKTACGVEVVRREPIADLGALPSPYLSGSLDPYIPFGVLWQLSRGCTFGCDFCFDGMGDRSVRRFSLERLEAELDYLVRRGAGQVVVLDSTFNLDRARAKALLRMMRKKAPQVHFHFEARAELLDAEQARLFGGMKCSLQIGLQTADPGVSRAVKRPLNRREFATKIGLLNQEGVVFGFDLIFGLPGDSLIRFRETLDFALGLYPNSLAIFPLAVLPGTVLAFRASELHLHYLPRPPYTLLESPSFSNGDLQVAQRLATACDIFYSRGKSVAWFNGIVAALRMSPAGFLEEFSTWLLDKTGRDSSEKDYQDEEIYLLQREFLTVLFAQRKARRLLPAALDFVAYHHHYAATLLAVPPKALSRRELTRINIMRQPLMLAPSTRLAAFNYEILDLLETGEPDLPYLCGRLKPSGSYAAIYPHSGEVVTESLAELYFQLLKKLDGSSAADKIVEDLAIPSEDAREFLAFALAEGIICLA
ncbi:MAG: B12-binding domain-containing radical SAM protein [Deltaproteobacteria bacterium]|nr:B12-binding domain-containing radical SAM protein [Deltaproteobacteria bacterium]TLN03487.1 MAG: B12-binding domain-containing radical SAM protein [bacterium]